MQKKPSAASFRLESKLDELKSLATEGGDRHLLEYLFVSGHPADLQRLAEEGFPQPPSQALSNSLTLALEEGSTPQSLSRGTAGKGRSSGDSVHHVLVAKVLMSHCHKVGIGDMFVGRSQEPHSAHPG